MSITETANSIVSAADSIQGTAAQIIALAKTLVEEPPLPPSIVIKRSLTTVCPEDVKGNSVQEKIQNAHKEAIERNIPMRWDKTYQCTKIELDDAYDNLVIEADGVGPMLPDDPSGDPQAWGWLYYINPKKNATITMRGVVLDGNRTNAAAVYNHTNSHTQHGIAVGNINSGRARVILEEVVTRHFDGAGAIVLGHDCELYATASEAYGNGFGGFENTRGRLILMGSISHDNDGLGVNPSSGEFTFIEGSDIYKNAGGGMKVSANLDGTTRPSRLHISHTTIRNNKGVGLTSTSASPGTMITGDNVVFDTNEVGSFNLTNGYVELNMGRVYCLNNGIKTSDDTVDILLFGGTCHMKIKELMIAKPAWRAISGGWGSRLEIGLLTLKDVTGPKFRWSNGPDMIIETLKEE